MHLSIVFQEALQVGLLKHLGDVETDLLDLVSVCSVSSYVIPDRLESHWIITINGKMSVWKCKLIFPTDTQKQLQQKTEITDLKPFLAMKIPTF